MTVSSQKNVPDGVNLGAACLPMGLLNDQASPPSTSCFSHIFDVSKSGTLVKYMFAYHTKLH